MTRHENPRAYDAPRPKAYFSVLLLSAALLVMFSASLLSSPMSKPLACSRFRWLHTADQARAGIAIAARVSDKPVFFQLDTGAAQSVLYANAPAFQHLRLPTRGDEVVGRLQLGRTDPRSLRFAINRSLSDNGHADAGDPDSNIPLIGTLGLDALVGRVVTLNFPEQRACAYELANAPPMPDDILWMPARLQSGRLFVTVQTQHRTLPGFFYDSGSSSYSLITEPGLWSTLTATDAAHASSHRNVAAWESNITFYGAREISPVNIGALTLGNAEIFSSATALFNERVGEQGLFGNQPFLGGTLVINLGPAPRLGFIRGAAHP